MWMAWQRAERAQDVKSVSPPKRRTVRHAADLGYLPILITDACGAGNQEAGRRSLASLECAGDALLTDAAAFAAASELTPTISRRGAEGQLRRTPTFFRKGSKRLLLQPGIPALKPRR